MCLDILRSPVAAIAKAKQKRDTNRVIITLLEIAAIFAVGASLIAASGGFDAMVLASSFLSSFSVLVIFAAVVGLVIMIAAVNLGGKGDYYEGFTAITYALTPLAVGLLVIALLLYVPIIGDLLALLVAFPMLASALSILYRAVKELYRTDMITAFVTVSITMTVLVLSIVFLSASLMQTQMMY